MRWIAILCCVISRAAPAAELDAVVQTAFQAVHAGWSADEVLLQDDLNARFLRHCRALAPDAAAAECNWRMLNLRKAGRLKATLTQRRRDDHQAYQHLAEIVARLIQNRHEVTVDRMMCDPVARREFNRQARLLAPAVDPYLMRKAAFGLRKSRRLRPELVLRVADWDRQISTYQASSLSTAAARRQLPDLPGIYIFRDTTGYLYVGESKDLRGRISMHLDDSDRQSLARYLATSGIEDVIVEVHAFPSDSPARKTAMRRAYESELIESRKPRLNVRP